MLHGEADFLDLVGLVHPPHDDVDVAERYPVAALDVAGEFPPEEFADRQVLVARRDRDRVRARHVGQLDVGLQREFAVEAGIL